MFNRLPFKNERPEDYILKEFGKQLNFILNSKTRWNSLVDMIERVLELKNPIQKHYQILIYKTLFRNRVFISIDKS